MASPATMTELVPDISAKYKYINPSKNFLSESMLNYILNNASQKAYYKLIQISKYFFVNQPPQIKTFEKIYYPEDFNPLYSDPDKISKLVGNRLWINTKDFDYCCSSLSFNAFLQRCFRVNISRLELFKHKLTYDELKFLMDGGKITFLEFLHGQITHSNGEEVAIEDILKMAPRLEEIHYYPRKPFTFSCQKTADLPVFDYLETIDFNRMTEDFSFCALRTFLKKAPKVTSGRFIFSNASPWYLRKFQIAVLKEVNPSIEVNLYASTIFFGDLDYEGW